MAAWKSVCARSKTQKSFLAVNGSLHLSLTVNSWILHTLIPHPKIFHPPLMAASLLNGAIAGFRSVCSPSIPHATRSFIKRGVAGGRAISPTLVSSPRTYFFVRCASTASSTESTSAIHLISRNEPVVSCDWLHANLREPDVKIVDASWYMPDEQRNPLQEYQVAHIPGALFLDVNGISDRTSNLPHMLPSEEGFAAAVSALGIHNKDGVIVYDGKGILFAARVWWMFRVFGHDKVWVLNGGLPQWRASGYEVESSASSDAILKAGAASEANEKVHHGQVVGPATFEAKFQPNLVWTLEQIKQNVANQTHQHVDARPKARFDGVAPEPGKGIKSGHVPGSKCIPFAQMLDGSQMLLPSNELSKRFEQEGISLERPVVASCYFGVTACILAMGLHRVGKFDVPVHDGSWTEWVSQPDTPVATA